MLCIIDCGSSYIDNLKSISHELGFPNSVLPMEEIASEDFNAFSHIIVSGSPTLITQIDTQRYVNHFSFLKTTDTPVLGICNGHQVLGLLFGATISIGEQVKKLEHISFVRESRLFQGIPSHSLFREEHSEYITLPEDFVLLATSASCENEAMQHTRKQLYGVQFHPEASGDAGKRLINNFLHFSKDSPV